MLMLTSLRSVAQPTEGAVPDPDQQVDPKVPDAAPNPAETVARPVNAPTHACGTASYVEPSLMIALGDHSATLSERPSNAGRLMHRLALGAIARLCDHEGGTSTHVRVGATAYLTNLDWGGRSMDYVGAGGEVEVNHPVASTLRIGGRIGVETAGASGSTGSLWTLGGRLHVREAIWLGLDVWHRRPGAGEMPRCTDMVGSGCAAPMSGVMVGLGIEGRRGAITSGVGLGVVGALLLLLVIVGASAPAH